MAENIEANAAESRKHLTRRQILAAGAAMPALSAMPAMAAPQGDEKLRALWDELVALLAAEEELRRDRARREAQIPEWARSGQCSITSAHSGWPRWSPEELKAYGMEDIGTDRPGLHHVEHLNRRQAAIEPNATPTVREAIRRDNEARMAAFLAKRAEQERLRQEVGLDDDEELDHACQRLDEIQDGIMSTPAQTPTGVMVKAAFLAYAAGEWAIEPEDIRRLSEELRRVLGVTLPPLPYTFNKTA